MSNSFDPKKLVACGLLLILALVSFFPLSNTLSSPDFHQESIEAMDEKKITVVELTAATALGSSLVAAVPGDATTPIANEIAQLSSYLMIIAGAIMLEKFLLTLTGLVAFRYLIPIACVLLGVWIFWRQEGLRRLAIRLTLFALAISLVIPVSLQVSTLFDETFHSQETVQESIDALEKTEETDKKPSGNFFANLKASAEKKLSSAIDSIATLLISNCVIPVLTLALFLWLAKVIFGLTLPPAGSLKKLLPSHKS